VDGSAPPAPPAGTTPRAHPAPAARRSPHPLRPVGSGKPKSVQRELAGRSMCINLTNPWVRREPWGGLQGGGLRR
jgi:hypothetical protein